MNPMGRSHDWVNRGTEFDRVPMNWGKNLTLYGAIRLSGWVALNSAFASANGDHFVGWLSSSLLPELTNGDVLVMDNLKAHHDLRAQSLCRRHGVRLVYLPRTRPLTIPWTRGGRFRSNSSPGTPRATRWHSGASPTRSLSHHRPPLRQLARPCKVSMIINSGDLWGSEDAVKIILLL
jgi:hypothetical protein